MRYYELVTILNKHGGFGAQNTLISKIHDTIVGLNLDFPGVFLDSAVTSKIINNDQKRSIPAADAREVLKHWGTNNLSQYISNLSPTTKEAIKDELEIAGVSTLKSVNEVPLCIEEAYKFFMKKRVEANNTRDFLDSDYEWGPYHGDIDLSDWNSILKTSVTGVESDINVENALLPTLSHGQDTLAPDFFFKQNLLKGACEKKIFIIEGGAGAGKTFFAHKIAEDSTQNTNARLALYCSAVELMTKPIDDFTIALNSHIKEKYAKTIANFNIKTYAETIGGCSLIFDGLDELNSPTRDRFSKELCDLLNSFGEELDIRIMLTTRTGKNLYEQIESHLPKDGTISLMEPFMLQPLEAHILKKIKGVTEDTIRQINESMPITPLVYRLLEAVHKNLGDYGEGDFPIHNMFDLFSQYFHVLYLRAKKNQTDWIFNNLLLKISYKCRDTGIVDVALISSLIDEDFDYTPKGILRIFKNTGLAERLNDDNKIKLHLEFVHFCAAKYMKDMLHRSDSSVPTDLADLVKDFWYKDYAEKIQKLSFGEFVFRGMAEKIDVKDNLYGKVLELGLWCGDLRGDQGFGLTLYEPLLKMVEKAKENTLIENGLLSIRDSYFYTLMSSLDLKALAKENEDRYNEIMNVIEEQLLFCYTKDETSSAFAGNMGAFHQRIAIEQLQKINTKKDIVAIDVFKEHIAKAKEFHTKSEELLHDKPSVRALIKYATDEFYDGKFNKKMADFADGEYHKNAKKCFERAIEAYEKAISKAEEGKGSVIDEQAFICYSRKAGCHRAARRNSKDKKSIEKHLVNGEILCYKKAVLGLCNFVVTPSIARSDNDETKENWSNLFETLISDDCDLLKTVSDVIFFANQTGISIASMGIVTREVQQLKEAIEEQLPTWQGLGMPHGYNIWKMAEPTVKAIVYLYNAVNPVSQIELQKDTKGSWQFKPI